MPTIDRNAKPATKEKAFSLCQRLLADQQLTRQEVESLYLYFMPPAPKTPRTPEEWVARFVASKDSREYLRYLYSDGHTAWGTDGGAMVWCPTTWPRGYYDPRTMLPAPDMAQFQYPNCKALLELTPQTGEPFPLVPGPQIPQGPKKRQDTNEVAGYQFYSLYLALVASAGDPVVTAPSEKRNGERYPSAMRGTTKMGGWLLMPCGTY